LSGLCSTRVVRFYASVTEAIDEPEDMATGPQDAEVSGCFEPLGAQGAIGDGGWRAFGMLGAAVSAIPSALRGGGACRAGRSPARQGVAASGAGGQAGVDAGRIPHASPGVEREAFSRAHSAAAWVSVGVHVDEDAAAHGGSGGADGPARGASSQTATQAVRRPDAASGWQPVCVAQRGARA